MSPVQVDPVGDDPLHPGAQGSRPQAGLPGPERIAEGKVRTGAGSPESALAEDVAAPLEDRLPPGDHPFQVFSEQGPLSVIEPGARPTLPVGDPSRHDFLPGPPPVKKLPQRLLPRVDAREIRLHLRPDAPPVTGTPVADGV